MIANPITYGNHHDSSARDFGESYLDFGGDYLHAETDCITQYVMSHSTEKVAGE
ncbi:hypothetical protein [Bacillus toyonensis]|uniref:hypothetical protein n=1 Tax=Bacillus thuringiensis TaxID=1428 RepID=UPI001BD02063|nr:hypothetical protein [Bacillus toyonensis]